MSTAEPRPSPARSCARHSHVINTGGNSGTGSSTLPRSTRLNYYWGNSGGPGPTSTAYTSLVRELTSTASGVAVAFGGQAALRTLGNNRQTSGAPLRETILQSSSFEPPRPQNSDRLIREDAIGTAAVCSDLLCGIELGKAVF